MCDIRASAIKLTLEVGTVGKKARAVNIVTSPRPCTSQLRKFFILHSFSSYFYVRIFAKPASSLRIKPRVPETKPRTENARAASVQATAQPASRSAATMALSMRCGPISSAQDLFVLSIRSSRRLPRYSSSASPLSQINPTRTSLPSSLLATSTPSLPFPPFFRAPT